jgi:hypothetical protein
MSATKSGRVSAGLNRASYVTIPPAEHPIIPTRDAMQPVDRSMVKLATL